MREQEAREQGERGTEVPYPGADWGLTEVYPRLHGGGPSHRCPLGLLWDCWGLVTSCVSGCPGVQALRVYVDMWGQTMCLLVPRSPA